IRRLEPEAIALKLFAVANADADFTVRVAGRARAMGTTKTALSRAQAQCFDSGAGVKEVTDVAAVTAADDSVSRHGSRLAKNETRRCRQRAWHPRRFVRSGLFRRLGRLFGLLLVVLGDGLHRSAHSGADEAFLVVAGPIEGHGT